MSVRCPYCREELAPRARRAACPLCRTSIHPECAALHRACVVYGCPGRPARTWSPALASAVSRLAVAADERLVALVALAGLAGLGLTCLEGVR